MSIEGLALAEVMGDEAVICSITLDAFQPEQSADGCYLSKREACPCCLTGCCELDVESEKVA